MIRLGRKSPFLKGSFTVARLHLVGDPVSEEPKSELLSRVSFGFLIPRMQGWLFGSELRSRRHLPPVTTRIFNQAKELTSGWLWTVPLCPELTTAC
jgi:hypothetical protein